MSYFIIFLIIKMLTKEQKYIIGMTVSVLLCVVILLVPRNQEIKNVEVQPYVIYKKVRPLIISTADFQKSLLEFRNTYEIVDYKITDNLQPKDWNDLANVIFSNYIRYDAFIILHKPDIICYTASALSFILENLGKTVLLTSDINEGLRFVTRHSIPEVVIADSDIIFRGCRTRRFKGQFISPNFYPLAVFKNDKFKFNTDIILKIPVEGVKLLPLNPNKKVVILKIYPGISTKYIEKVLVQDGLQAVILESYEDGILPMDTGFLKLLADYIEKGLLVVNVSATNDPVQDRFSEIDIISGGDMTTESVYTKLLLLISHVEKYNPEIVTKLLHTGLRGEIV
jgi:L-asparaginase